MARQGAFFSSFFTVKMTHLPIHHHIDYRTSPIVFILSEHDMVQNFCQEAV
jgi:hypothetical protein